MHQPDSSDRSLTKLECFAEVPRERVKLFDASCRWELFPRDAVILDASAGPGDAVFLVGGEARVVYRLENGGEIRLSTLGPYDVIGEEARAATVIADKESWVATMERALFLDILSSQPGVALALLQRFAGIIRTLNTRVRDLSLSTPQQRLYGELLRLARGTGHLETPLAVAELPHHDELAAWTNTSRDVVAYEIGALARRGIVERKHRTLYIHEPETLRNLASGRAAA